MCKPIKNCVSDGCEKQQLARGLCSVCYANDLEIRNFESGKICSHCKERGASRRNLCRRCAQANWKKSHKDRIKTYSSRYYRKHKESIIQRVEEYRDQNREKVNAREARRSRHLRRTDIQFKIREELRSRLVKIVSGQTRSASAVRDLGCSIEQLISYLSSKFQPGMSWDNWGQGRGKWHIDHIFPLTRVDLTDPDQLRHAVHYTNLQPLWSEENIRKSNRIVA